MTRSSRRIFRAGLVILSFGATAVTAPAQTSRPASTPASQPAAESTPKYKAGTMPEKPKVTPQHIEVQHILIGFTGSVGDKPITRTKEEAGKLAGEILEMARMGADFDTLVAQWTDDAAPGIYGMSNTKVPPKEGEFARERMVPAFGNVGFELSPGNIGMADYDPKTSPYGWHIIKRLK